jgi:hypothetical protein
MEASGGEGRRVALERPLLAGGEGYAHDIDFPPGGGSTDPWWSFGSVAGRVLPQLAEARGIAARITPEQRGAGGRFVIEAETMPNFLAASYYPEHIFRAADLIPVGSRASTGTLVQKKAPDKEGQPSKKYLLSASDDSLARLEGLYQSDGNLDAPILKDALKFTSFAVEGADQVLKMGTGEPPAVVDDLYAFEAVLHPQLIDTGEPDPIAGDRVRTEFIAYVEGLGGTVNLDFARLEADMWYLPVLLPRDPATLRLVASFAQLRALRPMPQFRQQRPFGDQIDGLAALIEGSPPTERRIAVFDAGLDVEALGLEAWVTEYDFSKRPRLAAHDEHGTTVTSSALFGPLDAGLGPPHTAIDHFRIWPMPAEVGNDIELPWVLDRIREVVERGDHKILIITLAPALNVEDSDPHLWTATLDRLALDHDVLFVVAAGNVGELQPDLNRLLVPADLINGLSVGSCSSPGDLAVRDSYSAVGPGRPGAMTAPTGVQFGGNLDARPFAALFPDGRISGCEGTSYAAPLVARGCAELDALLEGRASANLLRTVAVHQAERPSDKDGKKEGSTPREVGFGRLPASYTEAFDHDPNEITILYDGLVKRGQLIAVEIPVPDDVFEAAPTKLFEVRWTLGFFAPVEPANPVDYSSAGIHVLFRPHRARYSFTYPNDQDAGTYNIEASENVSLIPYLENVKECKRSTYPVTADQPGVATEVVRRSRDGKWEGVVRMDKRMQGKSLREPRLDFHMLTREGGDLLTDADDLRYALLVSIRAPKGIDLYDRVSTEATLLAPLTTSLPVLVETEE